MRDHQAYNDASLARLNEALGVSSGDARFRNVVQTGYEIQKQGQRSVNYEYDSKNFRNAYYAFIERHNSNVLKPDLNCVLLFKAFCERYLRRVIARIDQGDLPSFIDPVEWLSSKTSWSSHKKNRYF